MWDCQDFLFPFSNGSSVHRAIFETVRFGVEFDPSLEIKISNYVHIISNYEPFVLLPTAHLRQKYIITIIFER